MNAQPRYLRHRDAPGYLGMDRNRFDIEVRPSLVEIPIGERGIAFDRLDLDAWADEYKSRNGRSSRKLKETVCRQELKASNSPIPATELSTSSTGVSEFLHASARSAKMKPKAGSENGKTTLTGKQHKVYSIISATRQKGI